MLRVYNVQIEILGLWRIIQRRVHKYYSKESINWVLTIVYNYVIYPIKCKYKLSAYNKMSSAETKNYMGQNVLVSHFSRWKIVKSSFVFIFIYRELLIIIITIEVLVYIKNKIVRYT